MRANAPIFMMKRGLAKIFGPVSHSPGSPRRSVVQNVMPSHSAPAKATVIGPDLRDALVAMVRRRVPERDVEDIVQTALAEAFESPHAPTDAEALRRWLFGVAKNKVVDYHRKRGREIFEVPEVSEGPAPHAESDLLRWAKDRLPEGDDAHTTLDWMLREGDGEKLEAIAEAERLPAPRVRQRVSRLRRHFRTHWAKEVALLAALGVAITALVLALWKLFAPVTHPEAPIAPNIHPEPVMDDALRDALAACEAAEATSAVDDFRRCGAALDRASLRDPSVEGRADVQRFRAGVARALTAPIAPSPSASTLPPLPSATTTTPPPSPKPLPKTYSTEAPPPPTPAPTPKLDFKSSESTLPAPKSQTAPPRKADGVKVAPKGNDSASSF